MMDGSHSGGRSDPAPVLSDGLPCVGLPGYERCEAWTAKYDNPQGHIEGGFDRGIALAVGPAGDRVYQTGASWSPDTKIDFVTVARDADSGAEVWSTRFHWDRSDIPVGLAVSPDGSRVYVGGTSKLTAYSDFEISAYKYAFFSVVAYDAATGAELWRNRFDRSFWSDIMYGFAVTRDGDQVVATGESWAHCRDGEIATVAFDALTGQQAWSDMFNSHIDSRLTPTTPCLNASALSLEVGNAVAAGADGIVFVGGASGLYSCGYVYCRERFEAVTLAYDGDGRRVWSTTRAFDTSDFNVGGLEQLYARAFMDVSPDGRTLFWTGLSQLKLDGWNGEVATIARRTDTGEELWTALQPLESTYYEAEVSPDGRAVFVSCMRMAESGIGHLYITQVETTAVDGFTGDLLWRSRFPAAGELVDEGPLETLPIGIAVSPDSKTVYAAGMVVRRTLNSAEGVRHPWTTQDFATVAYDAADGTEAATALYNTSPSGLDHTIPNDVAAGSDSRSVFVGGSFGYSTDVNSGANVALGHENWWDFGLVTYQFTE